MLFFNVPLDRATIFDMASIIQVKQQKGIEPSKRDLLVTKLLEDKHIGEIKAFTLVLELDLVNLMLFNLEDLVRTEEGCTLENYKEITRLNDKRAQIKRDINALYGATGETKVHNGEVQQ